MAKAKTKKPVARAPAKPPPPTIDRATGIDLARVVPPVVDEYLRALGLGAKGTPLERLTRLSAHLTTRLAKGFRIRCAPCGGAFDARFVRCPYCGRAEETDADAAGERDAIGALHVGAATPAAAALPANVPAFGQLALWSDS